MTNCGLKEQKDHAHNLNASETQEQGRKQNCSDDFKLRVKKALEADDLCYNYETGFHYMKQ